MLLPLVIWIKLGRYQYLLIYFFFIEMIHINQSSHVELSKPKEKSVHMCGNVLVANIRIIRQKS
jgi:hypothetical protein